MLEVRHHAVPAPLQRYFERATLIDYRGAIGMRWHVIPNGFCGLSVLVADPHTDDEPDAAEAECHFTGVLPRALGTWCDRPCIVIAIRLTPYAAAHLPLDAHDLATDPLLPSSGLASPQQRRRLRDRVRDARTLDDKMQAFFGWAEALLLDRRPPRTRRIAIAETAMRMHDVGGPGVADAAARVGVTVRQLERDFNRTLGISPKRYAQIAKVQQFAQLTWRSDLNMAAVAAELGFADQAHMTRLVGEITGLAPAALLKAAATSEWSRKTRAQWGGRLVFV